MFATPARRPRWGRRAATSLVAGAAITRVLRAHGRAGAVDRRRTADDVATVKLLVAEGHGAPPVGLGVERGAGGVRLHLDAASTTMAALVDPRALPLADGVAAQVRAAGVLDATLHADAVLRELRRVLREGGTLDADVGNAAAVDPGALRRDPLGLLDRIDAARGRGPLGRRALLDGASDGRPRLAVAMTHAELSSLLRDTGFAMSARDAQPGLRGLLSPRLHVVATAHAPIRRHVQPWWPAMLAADLPLDYLGPRPEVTALVPPECRRALDIGCAAGSLGAVLEDRGTEVTGIEADPRLAAHASTVLSRVVVGDAAEVLRSGRDLDPARYDVIIAADVLEHLVDPRSVLRDAVTRLRPGGSVVLSVPNVRHWDTLWNLGARGVWPQRASGIHDRTHLRWFTRSSVVELLAGAGLEPEVITSVRRVHEARCSRLDAAARWLPGVLGELVTFQWLVLARRRP